jgi:hypothetical protein
MSTVDGVFSGARNRSYPYTFYGHIHVDTLVGGIPSDPNVAKGWIESKLKNSSTDRIQALIAETMVERNMTADEAVEYVNKLKNLNGFKKDPEQGLYIEGRQLKAALKEAVSVAVAADKVKQTGWGSTRKWLSNYFPEHVFVLEERLYLGVTEPTAVFQQFVHTHKGSSIQYQEYVKDAEFDFTVITDHDFTDRDWEMIWTTGEMNGLGASRSQGYGTYTVTKWDKSVDRSALKKKTSAVQELQSSNEEADEGDIPRVKVKVKA